MIEQQSCTTDMRFEPRFGYFLARICILGGFSGRCAAPAHSLQASEIVLLWISL